jgi:hypothetical protein
MTVQQIALFTEPGVRHDSSDTSREAADRVAPHCSALQDAILQEFCLTDYLTDEEVCDRFPDRDPGTVKKRRHELVERGLVEDSGQRRKNRNGSNVTVWRLWNESRQA